MERELQIEQIRLEFLDIKRVLNEKSIRWWCASRAKSYNRVYSKGGVSIVSEATGVSRTRIYKGLAEMKEEELIEKDRIRKQGAGRKKNNRDASWD